MTAPTLAADEAARAAAKAFQLEQLTADENTLKLLFTEARTHYGWQERDVAEGAQ